jgi:hypothetical protein
LEQSEEFRKDIKPGLDQERSVREGNKFWGIPA